MLKNVKTQTAQHGCREVVDMKEISLDTLVQVWMRAPEQRRAKAMNALRNRSEESVGPDAPPKVVRFHDAAKQLSITPRSLAYAMKRAGIEGVRLPGRQRAFGIRAQDLERLINNGTSEGGDV